jgi:aminopeptidase N
MKIRLTLHSFRALFLFAIVLSATCAQAQRRERTISTWKPLHYDVSVTFDDRLSQISSAKTEITLQVLARVKKIDLDFGDMAVDSVSVSGKPARYEQTANTLNVLLPQVVANGKQIKVTVAYHGVPKDGLILTVDRDGNPSATGDNWPDRVHHWIPCLDHPSAKAPVNFTITAPSRNLAVANGKLVSMTTNGAAQSVWRFEETKPIPAYCMVIAVNQGVKIDAAEKTVTPLSFYVPKKDSAYAPKGFSSADEALEFFSEKVAPYPYAKLALIVSATRFGGMENSSAIVFTNNLFDLRRNEKTSSRFGIPTRIENLVAHEIAHQWFGDSVTEATWADLWLSEGFAVYFAGLFVEKYEGDAAFREYMRDAAQSYFTYATQRIAPIHDKETPDLMKLLNENNYEKGAWVLHMLRARLGDDVFFRGLRSYYLNHREGNATTEDLRRELEKAYGRNLRGFFMRWIYGSGHPVYEVSTRPSMGANRRQAFIVTIRQIQSGPLFTDPIKIRMSNGAATETKTVQPGTRMVSVPFPHAQRPTTIEIDPDDTLLNEVVNKK